jgi:hypothetical protein
MTLVLGLIEFFIFVIISLLHFFWALGGKWAFESGLPTNKEGKRMLNPTKIDCAIVAFGLLLFAIFYLIKTEVVLFSLPSWVMDYVGWIISGIFILRAIGDFNYIGFFKRVRKTKFALNDTQFYAPLCLIIGVIGVLIEIGS